MTASHRFAAPRIGALALFAAQFGSATLSPGYAHGAAPGVDSTVSVAGGIAAQRVGLRLPADEKVAFNGAVSYDSAGSGPGSFMYPAPGLAGFAVAIATHGLLSGAMRDSEKQKIRDKANEVLLPYQPILGNYKYQDLIQASMAKMATVADKRVLAASAPAVPGETVIDSVPVFYMTQDQRALILENAVSIRGDGSAKPYENVIRVVSPARDEKDLGAYWSNADGSQLRGESARLFALSLDIALNDMHPAGADSHPYKTVRYVEGGADKMERGQLISEECNQVLLRTLRGNLMSVPRKAAASVDASAGCAAAPAGAR